MTPNTAEPVEICVEGGKIIGRFLPTVSPFSGLEPPISREEIERRKKEKVDSYSTAEVLAKLEAQ